MDQVDDLTWIGNQQDGMNYAVLQQHKITAVMNATSQSDNWTVEQKAVTPYLKLNQEDGAPIPMERIDEFVAWFELHKQDVVLYHCGAGVSRAATFAILSLMLRDGKTWDEAEFLVHAARYQINPNPILKASVMEWLQLHPRS